MTSDLDKRQTYVDFSRVKRDLQLLPPIPEPREPYTEVQNVLQDGPQSPEQLPQGSKRKRMGSPAGAVVETRAYSEELILPKAADAGVRPDEYVRIKNESPWQSLQKVYELKLEGFIALAIQKPRSCELVTVKNFIGSDSGKKVKRLQQTQYQSFVALFEAFHSEGSVHVVIDYVPISLAHLVASPAYHTEPQLAAILGQVCHIVIVLGE
ncbi:hypothetical protein N7G274_006280 [Stereocaulon virgatum]|uniref:Uncharacterized protein n=1 Tax=Stereocaulon virgatum TaxID=373712 RepID=A0ABR4A4H9_9LECA